MQAAPGKLQEEPGGCSLVESSNRKSTQILGFTAPARLASFPWIGSGSVAGLTPQQEDYERANASICASIDASCIYIQLHLAFQQGSWDKSHVSFSVAEMLKCRE